MGRVIVGQVIATTHRDSHGEQLTRQNLERLFQTWDDDLHVGVSHDLSSRPYCRAYNKRLENLPDGEMAFKMDIEVLDEAEFSKFGAFSIGFTRRHIRFGRGSVEAQLTVNSRQFDLEAVALEVRNVVADHTVEVVERVEKIDVPTAAIIVIAAFAVKETFSGFFKSIGASLHEVAKGLMRKDNPSAPSQVHFHLHLDGRARVPILLVVADPLCTVEDIRSLNEAALRQAVVERLPVHDLQRATAHLLPGGKVDVDFITNVTSYISASLKKTPNAR